LADQLKGVARGPVLDDLAVLKAADDDGVSHRAGHHGRSDLGEACRLTPVSQRHRCAAATLSSQV
jgi:hypothetical protein